MWTRERHIGPTNSLRLVFFVSCVPFVWGFRDLFRGSGYRSILPALMAQPLWGRLRLGAAFCVRNVVIITFLEIDGHVCGFAPEPAELSPVLIL